MPQSRKDLNSPHLGIKGKTNWDRTLSFIKLVQARKRYLDTLPHNADEATTAKAMRVLTIAYGEPLLFGVVYVHVADGDKVIPSAIPLPEKPVLVEMEDGRYLIVGPLTAIGRRAIKAYREKQEVLARRGTRTEAVAASSAKEVDDPI